MRGRIKIEIAPTSRSHCKECRRTIQLGELRVLEIYRTKFIVKDKYCEECGFELITEYIDSLMDMQDTIAVKKANEI